MLNNNFYKTSMIFLGILFLVIMAQFFIDGDERLVTVPETEGHANVACVQGSDIC